VSIPEGRGIFPNLSVAENLRMATFIRASYDDVLESVHQFPARSAEQTAGTLGGEQQMLSMARACNQPGAPDRRASMGLAPLIVEGARPRAPDRASGITILIVEQFAHETPPDR
jgi:branched-chain amino acid transport system ATP-binding protein